MESFCQSCAMPLNKKGIDNRGTEVNGEKSEKFCNLCYLNGKYTNPNLTYEDMLDLGINGMENSGESKIKVWIMKKSYPMLLKKCERWTK